jgi:hypothetical protein
MAGRADEQNVDGERSNLRKIRLIESNAKCRYLKKITGKGLCGRCTVKKDLRFSRAQTEIIKLFPSRESLISDIPLGDRKIAYLFFQFVYLSEAPSLLSFSLVGKAIL